MGLRRFGLRMRRRRMVGLCVVGLGRYLDSCCGGCECVCSIGAVYLRLGRLEACIDCNLCVWRGIGIVLAVVVVVPMVALLCRCTCCYSGSGSGFGARSRMCLGLRSR